MIPFVLEETSLDKPITMGATRRDATLFTGSTPGLLLFFCWIPGKHDGIGNEKAKRGSFNEKSFGGGRCRNARVDLFGCRLLKSIFIGTC